VFIHLTKKCQCGEVWVMTTHMFHALTNIKRVDAEWALIETEFQIHRTNHVLERLHKEVYGE
jgi:hypothetical protein